MSNISMNLGKDLQFLVIPSNVVSSEQRRLGRSFSFMKRALVCFSIIFLAFTQKAEAQCGTPLVFKNPTYIPIGGATGSTGAPNMQGAKYRFDNINANLPGYYAELTIMSIPAGFTVVSVDSFSTTSGGYDNAWQPAINSTNSAGGYVEWSWAFKTNASPASPYGPCMTISTIDNDGYNNGVKEYAGTSQSSFIKWGSQMDSVLVPPIAPATAIWKYGQSKLTTGSYEVPGIDSSNRAFTFEVSMTRSSFTWRTGLTGANPIGDCCRIFSMYFEPLLSFNPGTLAQPTPAAQCGVASYTPPTLGASPSTLPSGLSGTSYRYKWAYSTTTSIYNEATASQWTLMSSTAATSVIPTISQTTYFVRLASFTGSTEWRPSNVVAFYLPTNVTATIAPGPYCVGQTYQLTANSTTPLTNYAWTGPNGFNTTGATPTINSVTVASSGTYTVTASVAGGCSATATIAATFIPCNEICNNFIDDDGDGFIDEADPDSPCFDPGKTLACDDKLYMVRSASVATNTLIERLDILAGVPTLTTLFNKPLQLNALGQFNGFLYAMANNGTNLYRIDAYGTIVDLGVVAGLPIPDAQWSAGTIGRDGNFYIMEGKEAANHRLYKIPLLPGGVGNYVATQILGPAAGEINLPNNPTDIAMDETGTLYAFSQGGTTANVNDPLYVGGLFTIDLTTGVATRVSATNTYMGASLGSLFITDEGKIYGYGIIGSTSGYQQTNFYEINKVTGQITQVGVGATPVNRSDGASCPWRVTLKRYPSTTCFYPGVVFNWEYALRNQSGQAWAGVELRDTLDSRFSYTFNVAAMTTTLRAIYGNSVTIQLGNLSGGTNNVLTILGLNIPNQISTSLSLQTTIASTATFTPPSEVILQQAWLKNVATTRGGNEPSDNPITIGPFSDKTPVTVYITTSPVITAASSACLNNPISVTANNIPGVTYAWNYGSGATPATGTGIGPNSVSYSTVGAKTITLTVTSSTGCSASTTATVNSITGPTLVLGATPSVCRGTTTANMPYTSSIGSPNQYSINFDLTAEGQGFVDVTNVTLGSSPIVITVPSGAAAGTYNATLVVNNTIAGCNGSSQAIQVTVVAAPTITLSAIPSVCRGITSSTLPYSALSAGATQYSINFDATAEAQGFVDIANANISATPITITVPANGLAGTYNATFTVTNPTTGCVSTVRNITVQIISAVVSNAGADVNNCNGNILTLAANAPAPGNGAWTIIAPANGASISIPTTSPTATVNGLQAGRFVDLIWTITTGTCVSRDTVRVSNYLANSPACNCNNIYSISGSDANNYAGNQIRILNTATGTYTNQFGPNLGAANVFGFGLDTVYKRFYYSDVSNGAVRYLDSYGNDVATGVTLPGATSFNRAGYNPVDKKMYFISNNALTWVSYEPTASGTGGTVTTISTLNYLPASATPISATAGGGDIVFDAEGSGYVITNDGQFYKVVFTGTTANIIYLGRLNLPTPLLASLAFGSDGKLYLGGAGALNGAGTGFLGADVYSINLQTLVTTKLNAALTSATVDFASCSFPFYNSIIVPTKTYVKYGSVGTTISNGDTLEYTIKVKNTGNISAGFVRMFDAIPAGTTYVPNTTTVNGAGVTDTLGGFRFAITGGYLINGTTQAWRSGVIVPNDSSTIKFRVRVNISCGQVDNTATIYNGLLNLITQTNTLSVSAADPAIANAGVDQYKCNNGNFTLAGTVFPAVATGAWTIVGAANGAVVNTPTSATSLVTGLNPGSSVTLRWTVTSVCSSSSDDVVLTNGIAPTITLGTIPSVCLGTTSTTLPYSATTNNPDQYSIAFSAAALSAGFVDVTNTALSGSPITITIPAGAATATYNATLTIRNSLTGCTSNQSISVTINPAPVANAGTPVSVCSGSGVTIGTTAIANHTYAWSPATALSATNVAQPTANPTIATTYTVTVTNTLTGCTNTSSVLVSIATPPTITLGANPSVCRGTTSVNLPYSATTGTPNLYSINFSLTAEGQGFTDVVNATLNSGAIAIVVPSGAAAGTYSATLTVSNGLTGCPSVAQTIQVTVIARPTANAGLAVAICNGGSTTIGSPAVLGNTYAWNPATGLSSTSVSNPTANPTTTTTYTVTVTNAGGCTATSNVVVTVNPLASTSINASGPTIFCSNSSVTLTAIGGGTYAWSSGETTDNITKNVSGTYTVTVTNASGCTATASQVVTVNPLPTASISGTTTICNGSNTNLTAAGGVSYEWSTGATTASINVAPSVNSTYTVTVTNANGCTATASQAVTVNPSPIANISGTATICNGNNTNLTATGGGTYSWSTGAITAVINVTPSVTTTYTVTVTGTNGCTATASRTVTVNPTPTITLGSIASVCRGVTTTSLPYSATTGSPDVYLINFDVTAEGQGFTDVINAPLTAGSIAITVPAGAAAGTYNATLVVRNSATGCPSAAQSIQVVVLTRPTANAGLPVTICSGSSTTIGSAAVAGNTYAWSPATGLSSATVSNPTANPTTTQTYTVTVTNGSSCSATSSVTVTVNQTPAVTLSAIPSVCRGTTSASLPYNITAGTPDQYSITFNATALGQGFTNVTNATLSANPITIIVPSGAAAGSYSATIVFRNATTLCASASQNITVIIDAAVTASVTANPAQCNNGTFVLAGNAPSVGAGVWSVVSPASYSTTNISSLTLRTATASNVPAGTPVTLAWTVTNGACSSSSTVVLRNDELPIANAGPDASLCNATTYTLTPNTPSVGTGVWTVVSGSGTVTGNVLDLTQNVCNPATQATGSLSRDIYTGIGGTTINDLTSNANYPNNSNITNFIPQFSSNGYVSDNYGTRVRGYIRPTVSGNYTFVITGDDAIDFFLSTDANPANKTRLAYITAWTNVTEFTKYPTQTSVTVSLTAGQNYYTELLHKEGSGGDNFQVYWQTPSSSVNTIIPGANLVPFCTPQTTLRWTVTNGTCIATDDIVVTNSQPVTSNAGPDQIDCGTTFTMAAALPALGTGLWTIVSGAGVITTPSSYNTTVTGVTLGTTTVLRWTVTNGACSSFDEVSITNRALTLVAGGNLTVCPGMFIQFFANVNDNVVRTNGWNWSGPASFASLVQNPARPNATIAMGGTYNVTYSSGRTGCPNVSTTTTIVMSNVARATLTAKNTGPYCEGASIILDVDTTNTTPNGIWTWTLPNGTTMTGKRITIPNSTTAMNGIYSVQYALSGCDFYSSTVVVVYPNPTAAATNTGPFCYNTNINLFGSGVDPSACTNSTNLVVNGDFNITNAATRGFTSQYNYTSAAGWGNYFITNSPNVIWPGFASACVDHTTGTGNMLIADGINTANSYVWQQNVTTVEPNKFYKFSVWVNNLYTISYARIRLTINGQQVGTTLEMNYPVCQWVQVTGLWYSGNATTADLRIYDDETSGAGNDYALDDITFNCHTFPATASKWTWSGPNGYTSNLQNPILVNATPINSGIYTLVHTSVNGCTAAATTTLVIVKPNEPISFAGLDKDNCNNSTFVMTALDPSIVVDPNAGAGSGSWRKISGPGSISSLTDFAATVTGVTLDATTVYEWTVVRGTCIALDTVVLRNFRPVTSNAGSNQTLCNTSTFNIAATTPSVGTGVWSVVSGTGTVSSTNSVSTTVTGVNPNTTTVLRWTVTNGACNASSDISLTNNGAVTANAGTDQTQCNSGSFTLAGNVPTSPATGLWTIIGAANGATITAPTSASSGITGLTAGSSVTLRWTLTNGTCSSSDDVVLTNDASVTANANVDQAQCNNGSFTLAGNTPSVGSGLWTIVGAANGATITTPTSATSGITGLTAGSSVTLRWTVTNSTCSSSDDVVLTNNQSVTANANVDQAQCNSGSFTLAGNTPSVGSGLWTIIGAANGATITTPASATSGITGLTAGNSVLLRWTVTNGTCSSSDDVVLTNNQSVTANANVDQTQCNSGSFTLAGNTPSVGSGLWTIVGAANGATITTPASATSGITGLTASNSVTLRWTVTNSTCSSSDDVVLTNNQSVTANANVDQAQCNSGSFTLAGNTPSVGSGLWTIVGATNGSTITTPTSATSGVTGLTAGNSVTLRWTVTNGTCSSSDDVVLTNNSSVTANANVDQSQCNNGSFTLAGNVPTSPATGLWTIVGAANGATITTPTSATTGITGLTAGSSVTLKWTVSNNTCSSNDDVVLTNNSSVTANANVDQSQCNSGAFTLAGNVPTSPATGLWTIVGAANGATITTPTSATTGLTGLIAGNTVTLRWTVSNGTCSSNDDVILTNNSSVTANANVDQSKCNNGSFTLAGNVPTSPATGLWTILGAANGATITTPTSATTGVTGLIAGNSVTLKWTVSNGTCSSNDDVVLTNNSSVTANANVDQAQCNSGSFTLAGNVPTSPATGLWTIVGAANGATITTPASATSGVTGLIAGSSVTLKWTVSNGTCSLNDDVVLTNNSSVTANANVDQAQCNSGSFTLAGNVPTSPATGLWTIVGAANGATITTPTSATTGITGLTAGNSVTLKWTVSNGTCTSNDDVVLTNNSSVTANANVDQAQCNNGSFTLAGNLPTSPATGLWTIVGAANGATITTPTSATTGVTGLTAGSSVTLKWTVSNGTCSSNDDVVLTNNQSVIANADVDQAQCNNGSFTLAGNTPSVGSGLWTIVGAANGATITTPTSATSAISGLTAGNSVTLRWTVTNGTCSSSDDVVLTNNQSVTANANVDQTKCNNGSFTLAANIPTSPATGLWTIVGAANGATITTPASATSGVSGLTADNSVTLRWTVTNGTCSSSDDVVLTNNSSVTANANVDQSQCNNGSFTLAGNVPTNPATGLWTIVGAANGATITTPTSAITGITGLTAGTSVTLKWTVTNGVCSSSDDVILINNANVTANAGLDQAKCNTGSFTLAGNTPSVGNGLWTIVGVANGATITTPTSATSGIAGLTAGNSVTLRWTVTNGTCSSSDDVVLTNNTLPVPVITGITTICRGASTTLTVAGGGTYSWSTTETSADITVSPTANATYSVTVTNANSCTAVVNQLVTVNQPSSVNAYPNRILCAGDILPAINFTGTGTSYNWVNNTPGIGLAASGTGNIAAFTATNSGTTNLIATITVTPVANGCNGNPMTFTITVKPLPVVPVTANQIKCVGELSDVITLSTSGVTYNWTNNNTSIGLTGSGSGTISSFTTINTGSTPVVATINITPISNGCTGPTTPVTITVNPRTTPTITGITTICNGGSTVLTASGGVSYQWSNSALTADINISPATTTTYTVTATNSSGCTSTAIKTVIVNPVPTASISGISILCNGLSGTITASGGGTYLWSTNETTATIPVNPTTTTTYTVTVTNSNNCTSTASRTVTVNPVPTASISGISTICSGTSTDLTVTGTGTYFWSTNEITPTITVTPASTATYTVTVTNSSNCTATASQVVTVNPLPTASISGTSTICNGSNTTLTATGSGTFKWSTNETTAAITVNPTANTTYTVTVTNSNNCTATSSQLVTVNSNVTANANVDQAQCNNGSFTLAGNTPSVGSGLWTIVGAANGATITTPTSATSGVTGLTAGNSVTLRWTVTNGTCSSSDDVVLTNNSSVTANANVDQSQCNNGSFTLAGNVPTNPATGLWTIVGAANGATITTPTSATTGITGLTAGNSVTLRWTVSNNTCSTNDDVVLTNNSNVTANANIDQAQCNNGTFTLAANTPSVGSGSWTLVSGTATITTPSSPTTTVTGLVAGTSATLRWTVTNGVCPAATDDIVIRNNVLLVSNAGPDRLQCNATFITLAAPPMAASVTGVWTIVSGTGTITSPTNRGTSVTGIPAGTSATLRWTVSDGVCPSATDDAVLTNFELPIANAGADISQCNNSTFTMNPQPLAAGTVGLWQVASGAVTITTPTSPTTTITGLATGTSATLRWVVQNVNGLGNQIGVCTVSDLVVITNNAPVTANAGLDQLKCVTGSFTLAGNVPTSPATGLWTIVGAANGAILSTPTSATAGISGLTAGNSVTLNWTVTNGTCSSSDEVIMTNNANVTATAGAAQAKCSNGSFTLAANAVTLPVTGIWSVVSPVGFATSNISDINSNTATVSNVVVGTPVTLRWTVTNGACSSSSTVVLTNNPNPSVSAAPSAANYCSGTTIILNGTLISGNNTGATWSWAKPDGGAALTGQNPTRSSSTTAMAGVYTVTFTQLNGCSATATTTVSVTQQPAVTSGGGNQTLCNTSTFNLNATDPTVGAGQWIWVYQSGASISDITNRNAIVTGVAAGDSAKLIWRVTNGACFANSTTIVLKNLPRPTATINAPVTAACTGTSLTFSAGNVASGVTYAWTYGAGASVATATGANPASLSFSSCASRNVRLIATLNGCNDTAYVNVNTNDITNPVFGNIPANTTVECSAIPAAATNVTLSDNCGIVRRDSFETTTYACDTATYYNGLNAPSVNSYWKAEGRIGGGSYEMDYHRIATPANIVLSQADLTWHNNVAKRFTYIYNPNAFGANKVTYVLDNDTTNFVLKFDPSSPPLGAAFPLDFDALRIGTSSNSANATMTMDSMYLNGLPISLSQPSVAGGTRDVLVTGWKLNQGFVITGRVAMSWTGAAPTNSALNYGITVGKLATPCVADDCKQQNYLISRTWVAEDGCNNTIAATQVIKVQDTRAPVLTVPANISIECGSIPLIPTVTAVDNCDATPTITFNGEVTTQTTNGTCTDRNYTLTRSWTVVDNCGNASTSTQVITIIAAPLVDITVDHDAICESGSATLTSTLDCKAGTAQTYQWQQSEDASVWVNVASSGTSPTYTASGLTSTTHFRLLVTQGACVGYSDTITVSVVPTPSVLVTVDNAEICKGGNVTLTATVTGGLGGVEYYWQESTDGIAWASIAGANTNVFTTPALNANRYYRMATKGGEGCNVTSASTLITVVNDPSVSTQPQGFTECTGGTLQLIVVAAGGTPLLTYQWQKSDDGSTGWTDIAAATSTAYTPNSATTGTFYYRVVVSAAGSGCGTVISNPVTVVIAPDPEVQVTVPTTTVCTDGRVILTASPTGGTGTCTVQWQSKLDTSSTWNDVPGATGNTYQTNNLKATSNYRAVMSCSGNGCCN
jgi:hypothetical protein